MLKVLHEYTIVKYSTDNTNPDRQTPQITQAQIDRVKYSTVSTNPDSQDEVFQLYSTVNTNPDIQSVVLHP